MPDERDLRARTQVRDYGLRRLKTLTGAVALATAALAGIFAGLAQHSTAARKLIRVQQRPPSMPKTALTHHRPAPVPAPPPLPPLGSNATRVPTGPATPVTQPPAPTAAPPIVVSGGS